ncbi:MAG: hypothetical protein AAF730_03930 [Bacteroidota bacterium]
MPFSDPPRRPFVRPFSHTLNRIHAHETLQPDQLVDQARALLVQRFGDGQATVATASAPIPHPLLTDHVRHAEGLALVLMRSSGVGVAVRPADDLRVSFDADMAAADQDAVRHRIATLFGGTRAAVEVAIVHADIPQTLAYESLGILMALHRAMGALGLHPPGDLAADASPALRPLALALKVGQPGDVVLVDTDREDAIVVPPNAETEAMRWALVTAPSTRAAPRLTAIDAERLLRALHGSRRFSSLAGLRDLEHRDLEAALSTLSRSLQGPLRYWVTEGSRVQKMTAAVRKGDGQMMGALLLMADAARQSDAGARDASAATLAAQLDAQAHPELYGALPTGPGQLLVLGQAYALPKALERLQQDRPSLHVALI